MSTFAPASDSTDYNSKSNTSALESASNDSVVARRAIRGREATGGAAISSMPAAVPSSATNYGQRSPPLRHHQQHTVNILSSRTERPLHHLHRQQSEQPQQRQQQTEDQTHPLSATTNELSTQDDSTLYSSPPTSRPIDYERQGMKSMPVRIGGGRGTAGVTETSLSTYGHGSSVRSEELPSQIQRQQELYATIGRETSS